MEILRTTSVCKRLLRLSRTFATDFILFWFFSTAVLLFYFEVWLLCNAAEVCGRHNITAPFKWFSCSVFFFFRSFFFFALCAYVQQYRYAVYISSAGQIATICSTFTVVAVFHWRLTSTQHSNRQNCRTQLALRYADKRIVNLHCIYNIIHIRIWAFVCMCAWIVNPRAAVRSVASSLVRFVSVCLPLFDDCPLCQAKSNSRYQPTNYAASNIFHAKNEKKRRDIQTGCSKWYHRAYWHAIRYSIVHRLALTTVAVATQTLL